MDGSLLIGRSPRHMPGGEGFDRFGGMQSIHHEFLRREQFELQSPRTPPLSNKRVEAKVQPVMEFQDPDLFELSLKGNEMLPIPKRRGEFVALSDQIRQIQGPEIPNLIIRNPNPVYAAREIEAFVNILLAAGLHEAGHPCSGIIKGFLGLHHMRGNPKEEVSRRTTPMSEIPRNFALSPPSNLPLRRDVPSEAERAAALEEIRRRRAVPETPPLSARSITNPDPITDSPTARDIRNVVLQSRTEMLRAQAPPPEPEPDEDLSVECCDIPEEIPVDEIPDLRVKNGTESKDTDAFGFSEASFRQNLSSSASTQPFSNLTNADRVRPEPEKDVVPANNKKAMRQSEAMISQMEVDSPIMTWVRSEGEDGFTFTQSVSDVEAWDSIPLEIPSTPRSAASTTGNESSSNSSSSHFSGPAPMEASSSTSNRVAAVAGYTSSFRDIRSKFMNLQGSGMLSDQEYESSLSMLPVAAELSARDGDDWLSTDAPADTPRGAGMEGGEEKTFKPSTAVFEQLIAVMRGEGWKEGGLNRRFAQIKAGIVLCNLCCNSTHNREMALRHRVVPALEEVLAQEGPYKDRMHEVAAACLANLAAEPEAKRQILDSSLLPALSLLLSSENLQAAAQAAGALWSLCVNDGEGHARAAVVTEATIRTLTQVMRECRDTFLHASAAGFLSECCIGNPTVKSQIANAGGMLALLQVCQNEDLASQKLAACALCNLVANHPGNKRLGGKLHLIREMGNLLKNTQVMEIQCAAASCIFNLACKSDTNEIRALELLPTLRKIKSSRHIDVKLQCVTSSVGEANSPAFGTF